MYLYEFYAMKYYSIHTGPCVSVDTACSSSLLATHLGHQALHMRECRSAAAGGTNVMLLESTTSTICQLQALSPVGRCKSFDSSGDGYGRGEGFAVVVMQRQGSAAAASAEQHVYAIVRGSATNQGGRSSGLTAPNGPAQTALVRAALAAADVAAARVNVVSVHGTGTPLGDPIEVGALAQALPAGGPMALVSNKSCYGHTEGTAGLTGLFMAASTLRQGAMPPIMHLRKVNPYVEAALGDWGKGRGRGNAVTLPRQMAPAGTGACSAGMLASTSSFGMSGVNAHMILDVSMPSLLQSHDLKALAFQRERYWCTLMAAHPLLHAYSGGGRASGVMQCSLSAPALSYLLGNQVGGAILIPASALLEICSAAALGMLEIPGKAAAPALLHGLSIPAPFHLPNNTSSAETIIICEVRTNGTLTIKTKGTHMVAMVGARSDLAIATLRGRRSLGPALSLRGELPKAVPPAMLTRVALPQDASGTNASYWMQPAMLDCALHSSIAMGATDDIVRVPASLEAYQIPGQRSKGEAWAVGKGFQILSDNAAFSHHAVIPSATGAGIQLQGFMARPVSLDAAAAQRSAASKASVLDTVLYSMEWQGTAVADPVDLESARELAAGGTVHHAPRDPGLDAVISGARVAQSLSTPDIGRAVALIVSGTLPVSVSPTPSAVAGVGVYAAAGVLKNIPL
jgi:hypothetical protein